MYLLPLLKFLSSASLCPPHLTRPKIQQNRKGESGKEGIRNTPSCFGNKYIFLAPLPSISFSFGVRKVSGESELVQKITMFVKSMIGGDEGDGTGGGPSRKMRQVGKMERIVRTMMCAEGRRRSPA
jgi:hypothetical protein